MRDAGLVIALFGGILVSFCIPRTSGLESNSSSDEPVRMASDSLVVKSYKDAEPTTLAPEKERDSFLNVQIYQGVMGRPGVDFPVYSHIPVTGFSCRNVKKSGYYADLETDCQVFHVCDRNRKISFLCPNGTIFRQSHLICDWWFRVDCGKSVELYDESAEQLAADQKVYKERAEERERRRKLAKTLTSNPGVEVSSAEVNDSDEFIHSRPSSFPQHQWNGSKNQFSSSTARPDQYKTERHSKKVPNHESKLLNFNTRRYNSKESFGNAEEERETSFSTVAPIIAQQYSRQSQSNFKLENTKENIHEAESGSLVEKLSNISRNFRNEGKGSQESDSAGQRKTQISQNAGKKTSTKLYLTERERDLYFSKNEGPTEQPFVPSESKSSSFSAEGFTQQYSNEGTSRAYYENSKESQTFRDYEERNYQSTIQNFDSGRREGANSFFGKTGTRDQDVESHQNFPSGNINNNYYQSEGNHFENFDVNVQSFQTSKFESEIQANQASPTTVSFGTETELARADLQNTFTSEKQPSLDSNFQNKFATGHANKASHSADRQFANQQIHTTSSTLVGGNPREQTHSTSSFSNQQAHSISRNFENNVRSTTEFVTNSNQLNFRTTNGSKSNYDPFYSTTSRAFQQTEDQWHTNFPFSTIQEQTTEYRDEYQTTPQPFQQYNSNNGFSGVSLANQLTRETSKSFNDNNFAFGNGPKIEAGNYNKFNNSWIEKSFDYTRAATEPGTTFHTANTNPPLTQETFPVTTTPEDIYTSPFIGSSPSSPEEEKQLFAETASFGSNRGGKSYPGYGDAYDRNKNAIPTTGKDYQTARSREVFYTTQVPRHSANNLLSSAGYEGNINKSPDLPVTLNPPSDTRQYSTNWPTTTPLPYYEMTTANSFAADNVYFTTPNPEKPAGVLTTFTAYIEPSKEIEFSTNIVQNVSPKVNSDISLSLPELNINREVQQKNNSGKSYEDLVREGLEVPPSSGPNAIRSFALYFGNSGNLSSENGSAYSPVTHQRAENQNSFELKKKEVLKQVDELVLRSSLNVSKAEVSGEGDKIPNSLTPHTKESYLTLFPSTLAEAPKLPEQPTGDSAAVTTTEDFEFKTTDLGAFTEEPTKINSELSKNDLHGSQSRGLAEPEPEYDPDTRPVNPDLRRLAQVFTKALSAYLDNPEAFRKILSEIRPTEPTVDSEGSSSSSSNEYPSATKEDDEVLDFSDVTKTTYKKKSTSDSHTAFSKEPTTTVNEIDNLVVPVNATWATNVDLTAPILETLDQSQSSYYTAPTVTATTNSIAEDINRFISNDESSPLALDDASDSYLPITTTGASTKYGGFQVNDKKTTKYSPYGAELSTPPSPPITGDLPIAVNKFEPAKVTVSPTHQQDTSTSYSLNFETQTENEEIQLAKELNNLVLLQKFTTPRRVPSSSTTPLPHLSSSFPSTLSSLTHFADVKQTSGESFEKNVIGRTGRTGTTVPVQREAKQDSYYFDLKRPADQSKLKTPASTPKGFLITYSLLGSSASESATYAPTVVIPDVKPTTFAPNKENAFNFASSSPVTVESGSNTLRTYLNNGYDLTTQASGRTIKSLERIAELQETLMFNTNDPTSFQRNEARETVEKALDRANMTDSTTNALMKVMEMAAKNETYRRLVLLLVNDKSGKNKTVEEARLTLLKALLTPVIRSQKTFVPIPDTSKLTPANFGPSVSNVRRSKSIRVAADSARIWVTTDPTTTGSPRIATSTSVSPTTISRHYRKVKVKKELVKGAGQGKQTELGNLGVLRRTIENTKSKQVKSNSVDDAILDSDSRAVELLRSLYSLAARWG